MTAAKINQPAPPGYYQQTSYPNPPIQQRQPLPNENPMLVAAGDYSITCNCPYCYQLIVTKTEKNYGAAAWLSAAAICVFGGFCGCCLIPFCIDDLKV